MFTFVYINGLMQGCSNTSAFAIFYHSFAWNYQYVNKLNRVFFIKEIAFMILMQN